MQAFLLLFGLLFRPGASVRLKTVGESWEGPTLDGPQAIIPVSQLYPALTQDENATWFTIHTVGTFACWAFPAGGGGGGGSSSSSTAPALGTSAEPAPANPYGALMLKKTLVCVCVCAFVCTYTNNVHIVLSHTHTMHIYIFLTAT